MGGIMATVDDVIDDTAAVERLALLFATLQAEHASRSEEDARRISCDAIRSWGEDVPVSLALPARAAK